MKALSPKDIWVITPKNEGNVGFHGSLFCATNHGNLRVLSLNYPLIRLYFPGKGWRLARLDCHDKIKSRLDPHEPVL